MENNKKELDSCFHRNDNSRNSNLNFLTIPVRVLSSRAFLFWITGAWILYYVLSAIWIMEAFAFFVSNVRENLFAQIPYIIFLISGVCNLLRASIEMYRKNRIRLLMWFILPAGVLLFFTGFFLSVTMREAFQGFAGEGDVISTPWGAGNYRIIRIDPGLKEHFTSLEAVTGIFSYEPKMTVVDNRAGSALIGAFPPAKLDGTYYHILNFGIAPGVRLSEGNIMQSDGYFIMKILTPGSSDFFEITNFPYRFLVSLEPEKVLQQEGQTVSHFNLKKPHYNVRVFRGEKIIAEGTSQEGIRFDAFTINFYDPIFWVLLEAVKDPGVPVMHAGIVLITFGIPVYIIGLLPGYFRRKAAGVNS